jgi:hypothetical protein
MELLCGFARWLNGWHNWWPAGQLGENGEYWMGRKESGLIWYSELQGGSPCLCWLRHASVDPYWTSSGMYNWIVSGHPRCVHRGIYVEDGTRARYDLAQLFDSIVNCCTHGGSGPTCVMLSGLYSCMVDYWFESLWHPRTWVIACSLCLNIELSTS